MIGEFLHTEQFKVVNSFEELIKAEFREEINAFCWERNLAGDFKEVVSKLKLKEDVTDVSIEDLLNLCLSVNGSIAREQIINDLTLLTDLGALPVLNLIKAYPRDQEFDFISTDVYSFHVDRSPVSTDTFLCTYHGAAGDIIPNNQVEQKILIPEIRQKLKDLHDGAETEFEDFLKENYFDMHYQLKTGSTPVSLGIGNLWRLAVDRPGQQVLPCVHRAPLENDGEYRLLLIC
ncbi:DUF1826 domain-containing protein [Pedobacter sp.]|uniref:DUF1826 domain-containing protein n=1 Tax=Pedobacter sp. TaxID=1411316 RepID=UPI003BAC62E3